MHPQLEILLQIQDLKAQRGELAEGEGERRVEVEEFNIDIDQAIEQLDEKIEAMEGELSPPVRSRYGRIKAGRGRPVVPVVKGICYGCFVAIPTAVASTATGNDELRHCDNCGRFIYVVS